MEIKGAVFDLDGVLADTAGAHFEAWLRLAKDIGVHFDEQINERFKGVPRMVCLNILLKDAKQNFTASEKHVLAEQKNSYYGESIDAVRPSDLLPGAKEILTRCHACGIKTALASASRNAPALIERLGISRQLDYIAHAKDVTHPKPHPEIFLTAANGLLLKPQDCIAFEDAVAGVASILAADMFAIGIGSAEQLGDANLVFDSLADFSLERLLDT